jgi:hypothetical protein
MEPVTDEQPARTGSFSHSHTSPDRHPAGPRRSATAPATDSVHGTEHAGDDLMGDDQFVPSGLLPPAAPRPQSSVPSPKPQPSTMTDRHEPRQGATTQPTTSPYFTSDASSSTGQYGSRYTTVTYPAEKANEVEHLEHATLDDKPASFMDIDLPPGYQDAGNTLYDDKSVPWAAGAGDYRSVGQSPNRSRRTVEG